MLTHPPGNVLAAVPDRGSRRLHRLAFRIVSGFDRATAGAPRQLVGLATWSAILAIGGCLLAYFAAWAYSLSAISSHHFATSDSRRWLLTFALAGAAAAGPLRLVGSGLVFVNLRAPVAFFFLSLIPWPIVLVLAIVTIAASIVGGVFITPAFALLLAALTCLRFAIPRSYRRLASTLPCTNCY